MNQPSELSLVVPVFPPILRDVVDYGTGARIRNRYGITAPMGGKTGTTNDNSDGWFMAFTPGLIGGTWVGGE